MQRQDTPKFLDLRGATCPMAFVKTKIHLDKLSPGDRTVILYELNPENEPLVRSIRSLGHEVLSEKLLKGAPLTIGDRVTINPPPDIEVQLTILEIEVKI